MPGPVDISLQPDRANLVLKRGAKWEYLLQKQWFLILNEFSLNLKICERRLTIPEKKVYQRLDLIGMVCPYPTVKTIVALSKMDMSEVLEVITDYYPARQTIPDLMQERGYPCELIDGEDPVFRFIIQKI